ncbi:MAG: NAD(P)/FAD-dependent oxidoreductase [Chloroflexota bacterium]|nr:NAD(P)/FAD-dependent oxidoreductase [Chloroflexota bacterium]
MAPRSEKTDVLVVGGGPAGAALAIGLARLGRHVVVVERAPAWRWRACGVFTSRATVGALARLGVAPPDLERLARRVPAMRVETAAGTTFRLTYGDDGSLRAAAVGLDRSALDPHLLAMAGAAGSDVRLGITVRAVRDGIATLGDGTSIAARIVIGADGLRSVVARDAGVVRRPPLGDRPALTFHVEDPEPGAARDARMIVFDGGYVGLAPVPGGRVNVGIVLADEAWRRRLRADGAEAVARAVMAAIPAANYDPVPWRSPRFCDEIAGAAPVGSRVARRAGADWLLVGDAAGFLDPFTGEGLHRALRSAELATAAVDRSLDGDAGALDFYDRALARRTRAKDLVSLLVQAFLAVPPAFDYAARRLADRPAVRETMGRVIGDLAPASHAFDPRFLAALLRP